MAKSKAAPKSTATKFDRAIQEVLWNHIVERLDGDRTMSGQWADFAKIALATGRLSPGQTDLARRLMTAWEQAKRIRMPVSHRRSWGASQSIIGVLKGDTWGEGFLEVPGIEIGSKMVPAGTCQICERIIMLDPNGTIHHHGYERPGIGYQTESCSGARGPAYEAEKAILERWVVTLRNLLVDATEWRRRLLADEVSVLTYVYRDYKNRVRHEEAKVCHVDVTKDTKTLPDVPVVNPWKHVYDQAVLSNQRNVDELTHTLNHQYKRVIAWKVSPALEVSIVEK